MFLRFSPFVLLALCPESEFPIFQPIISHFLLGLKKQKQGKRKAGKKSGQSGENSM
jgi:hypothetical protein